MLENRLSKHPSHPFNPDIANAFFRAGMIEAWGRGIERIMEACTIAGVAAPTLRYEEIRLWVEFAYRAGEELSEKTSNTTRKTTQKILAILREYPSASRREIAAMLNDITENGVTYHLGKLKTEGRIRRIGPDKGGHWHVVGEEGE